MISSHNLRVSWKPVNPQECGWKNLYQIITRTILQERRTSHCNIIIWYTNLFLCLKPWRFPQQKAAVDKEWEKLEKIPAWNLTKVRSKSEVIEARTKRIKVHFASLMDICIWRMPNWRQSTKNTKVELYSEATLWKMILDLMQYSASKDHQHHKWRQQRSWISYPDGQDAQDKQLTQYLLILVSKWKMLQNYWKFSQIGISRHMDSSTTTQMAKVMVQNGRSSRSSWTKSVRSPSCRTIMGVAIWENPIEVRLGVGFQIENVSLYTMKKNSSYLCVWMTSNWLERNKILIRCGKHSTKKSIWESQHLSWDHVYLGCTQRQCEISKDIVDNYRTMFESRISAGGVEKLPSSQNLRISSWSYDMEGHAKKCVERYCELANKTTQQLYKVSTPCIDDHHFE